MALFVLFAILRQLNALSTWESYIFAIHVTSGPVLSHGPRPAVQSNSTWVCQKGERCSKGSGDQVRKSWPKINIPRPCILFLLALFS